MSGVGITVDVDASQLKLVFDRIERAVNDPRKFFGSMANYFENATQERFDETRSPDGSIWKPSKRALNHQTMGGSPKTLNDTGRLMASMQSIVNERDFQFGTNTEYGPIHQFGGVINKSPRTAKIWRKYSKDGIKPKFVSKKSKAKNIIETEHNVGAYSISMPARPFLGINDDDVREIENRAVNWLSRAINGEK